MTLHQDQHMGIYTIQDNWRMFALSNGQCCVCHILLPLGEIWYQYVLQDFITRCLEKDPTQRPTAHDLLFHPVLFEVHTLKLLTAHVYVKEGSKCVRHMFCVLYIFTDDDFVCVCLEL